MERTFQPMDLRIVEKSRRDLPHWKQDGGTYFVTFRTWDSLDQKTLERFREEKELWLHRHPKPWTHRVEQSFHRYFTERLDYWLNQGLGACLLKRPEVRYEVISAMRHFDGERYSLDEFVIMPNHAHALLLVYEEFGLSDVLHSWKSFTANRINRLIGGRGRFWVNEGYDRLMRDWEEVEYYRRYIRENPDRAGLLPGHYSLGRGCGIRT